MIITHEFMRHCLVHPSRAHTTTQQIIDGNSGLLLLLVSQLVFPHVSGQILHFIGATSRVKMRVDVDVSQYCDSQSLMTPAPAPAPRPISLYAALVSPICRPAVDKSALSMCVTSMCVCVCVSGVCCLPQLNAAIGGYCPPSMAVAAASAAAPTHMS